MKTICKDVLSTVGKYAKTGCKIAGYGLITALSYLSMSDVLEVINENSDASYSKAVGEIMSSSMWSEDKKKAITVLKQDKNSDFYKAVIKVVKSSMWSDDKVEAIEDMCSE